MQIIAHQGDTVDAICYRHFGQTRGITEQVLLLNPGLASYGPVLPMGITVQLPDQVNTTPAASQLVNLWD